MQYSVYWGVQIISGECFPGCRGVDGYWWQQFVYPRRSVMNTYDMYKKGEDVNIENIKGDDFIIM